MPAKEWKALEASKHAKNTTNPIRKIVDQMKSSGQGQGSTKSMISLSIGDPTTDGNLLPPPEADEAMIAALKSHKNNGYPPSVGTVAAREAVAKYWITNFMPNVPDAHALVSASTITLGSGASQAILLAFTALCNPGDNILLPSPSFSLYGTICDSYGIEVKRYSCVPSKHWEADLDEIRAQVNDRTRALFINNPSNPCGSNFTRAHVEALLSLAEELKLVVISDEIYAGMVFEGQVFTSVADIASAVPRIVIGGTAKNFVVPGWRLGWSIMIDPQQIAGDILAGMVQLSTLIVGPNAIVQGALDAILNGTPRAYQQQLNTTLQRHAHLAYDTFKACPGLTPITPQGAMYLMVGVNVEHFRDIHSGVDFSSKLQEEENVQVLPGEIFHLPNYFRVVYTKPEEQVKEAVERIKAFCVRHAKE